MNIQLKNIYKSYNIDEKELEIALDKGIQAFPEEFISIPFSMNELPSNVNLFDRNAFIPFVENKIKDISIQIEEKKGSVEYLKSRLVLDYLRDFIFPHLINIDFINTTLKLTPNQESFYFTEIFNEFRKNDDSIIFFYLNNKPYFYKNNLEFGFCADHNYNQEQLDYISSFAEYQDDAIEVEFSNNNIIPISCYSPCSVGIYDKKDIENT